MSLTQHTNPVVSTIITQDSHRIAVAKPLPSLSLRQLCQLPHAAVQPQQRLAVMCAARVALADPAVVSATDADKLAALAHYLCDWPLLQMMQDRGLWHPAPAEQVRPAIQFGQFARALGVLEQSSAAGAAALRLQPLRQALQQMLHQQAFPLTALQRGAVSLTPLQFHHVADFIWQYADPNISRLCNLPAFPSAEHWMTWLYLCQQEPARQLFAVMHADYGFIGSVSLQVFDGIGFFYYWLGADFQGQGFGPLAVEVLMQLGRQHLGMDCCYAKVFDYNLVSNKAISKLGFQQLALRALPPSEAEVFYYRGAALNDIAHHSSLGTLLQQMNSGIELAELPPR
ncbi:N-acetyltransferase [Rheinheimera riviphila]|uniref:N-acetyltransferase n=1 Tax=Rheinheimera riviphila TaxID=1834037 RepID=A0A437QG85_9GAMM|nr:GNAT family N-acetyltransferase [Rheinheimera riviphila]RVU33555.1 N-acetyltransferase [Rheinheimera riviphila]